MPGTAVALGPFAGGLNNASGSGEGIDDKEVFSCLNLEVALDGGSLVNRPAIRQFAISGISPADGIKLIGTFLPENGERYIVAAVGDVVHVIDVSTGASAANHTTLTATCCIQYQNRLYVIPQATSAGDGGYFDEALTWTAVAAIPRGDAVVLYKERIWVAAGITATSNTSRFSFSAVGDGTTWGGADFIDLAKGNGEKLVYMTTTANDIILFKEHSTWRFGYASDPAKADTTLIDNKIGVPAINCAVTYNNNTIYVLHDNSVYELYGGVYTRISDKIELTQVLDNTLYSTDLYGLTLHRDRLFVRYYSNLYVLSLRTQKWAQWSSTRKFSRVVSIPSATIGLDVAYAHSASTDTAGELFTFIDDRTTGVGTDETFTCSITTKTYDFDVPHKFKMINMWQLQIATSSDADGSFTIPNSSIPPTWYEWGQTYTWYSINAAGITWNNQTAVTSTKTVTPTGGAYGRKIIKYGTKQRFRQGYFTISCPAVANTVLDSSVKLYDITVFLTQKQNVVRETT